MTSQLKKRTIFCDRHTRIILAFYIRFVKNQADELGNVYSKRERLLCRIRCRERRKQTQEYSVLPIRESLHMTVCYMNTNSYIKLRSNVDGNLIKLRLLYIRQAFKH